jgi:ABC-type dipeptide/oligopeptide/nickel transport system permease subunit
VRGRILALALLALAAVGAACCGGSDGGTIDLAQRFASPSLSHPLGTDQLGRDLLGRLAEGAGPALAVVLIASAVALLGGLVWATAILAAPGALGALAERTADLALAVPTLIVGIVVAAVTGLSPVSIALALGVSSTAANALIAVEFLRTARAASHVRAAQALGGSALWVLRRHMLPQTAPALLIWQTYHAGRLLLAWAALSFLGLGADTSRADWGAMVWEYRLFLFDHPRLVLAPMTAIFGMAWALARIGDPAR